MNNTGNLSAFFWKQSFVLIFILFSLIALTGNPPSANAQNKSVWHLKQVRVSNTMDANLGKVTSEKYDADGGAVEINVSGGLCPGGVGKIRFTWKFDNNVAKVFGGNTIGANLEARQASGSKPCAVEFASRSYLYMQGTGGQTGTALSREEVNLLDERFDNSSNNPRVTADPNGQQTATKNSRIQSHQPNPKYSLAYFVVVLTTPTASGGGEVRYIYLYELGGK